MAWIIEASYIEDDNWGKISPVNITGPATITDTELETLGKGIHRNDLWPLSIAFKMFDADGELYYRGRSLKEDFAPLDDFGAPNAGCARIDYKQPNGTWATL